MSQARAGLWPREDPRYTKSEAEKKVYDALKTSLLEGWHAWHSLKIRTKTKGEFSEADFIIADPNRPSILVIEVKGGQLEQKDGLWLQNSTPLKVPPLEQAFWFRTQLIECFKENIVKPPTIGLAACFPDTFFSQQPTQNDLRGLIIGGQDLHYLSEIFDDIMRCAVPDPRPVKGHWIRALHEFWGETWVPKLRLGDKIRLDQDHRIQLDNEQLQRLDEIEENDRVLIRGAAGTGKTLLARETAIRQAAKGRRVLLLCFTDALSHWLSKETIHPNVTFASVRQFAAKLLGENTEEQTKVASSEYWNSISLRAAIDGLPAENELWDSVIVDEGQDFSEEDWELVFECLRKNGRLWIFADEDQAFWKERSIPDHFKGPFFQIRLNKPYRCPPGIQNLSDCYAGRCQIDPQLVSGCLQADIIRLTRLPRKENRQTGWE